MKRAPVGTIFHWVRTGAPDTWCNRYNVLLKRCGQLGIPRPSCTTWALRAGSFVAIYTVYIYITILEYIEYVCFQSRGCKKEKKYLEYMGPNMVLRIFCGFYFFVDSCGRFETLCFFCFKFLY